MADDIINAAGDIDSALASIPTETVYDYTRWTGFAESFKQSCSPSILVPGDVVSWLKTENIIETDNGLVFNDAARWNLQAEGFTEHVSVWTQSASQQPFWASVIGVVVAFLIGWIMMALVLLCGWWFPCCVARSCNKKVFFFSCVLVESSYDMHICGLHESPFIPHPVNRKRHKAM